MGIRLVVTDLDGTLLDQQHRVSAENKEAIREAVARGVTVTIATGRMYISALPYAKQLEVDVPIITYNGALIKSVSGEVLFKKYIAPQEVRAVAAFCRARGWYLQIYQNDALYFESRCDKAKGYEALAGIEGVAAGEALYQMEDEVPKMLIITDSGAQTDEFIQILQAEFGERIFATKSNPTYIEIVHPSVNKATALDILMEKLDVRKEEVMAIGDSGNDLPMLKEAGLSIAMDNAGDAVKALCDFVTEDCAHSGVAAAIRRHVLQA